MKMSSQDYNKIFEEAKDVTDEIVTTIQNIKDDVTKKLMIINYANEFTDQKLNNITTSSSDETKIVFTDNVFDTSTYSRYNYIVHPKIKSSIDIFNLKLLSGNVMFKQNIKSYVNGIEDKEYINLLKADNVYDKKIVFDEMLEDTITLTYEIDNTISIGTSRFNTIEIDPFISGAYSIESINFYNINTSGSLSKTPIISIDKVDNIGKTRIILDKKIRFSKVTMKFKCNFSTMVNGVEVYPFGLRHIHFMEMDFLPESYVIAKIESDSYIDYINDKVTLYSASGKIDTTCSLYDIEIYNNYDYNTLTGRVYTSTKAGINRIAKNVKTLYAKIPLIQKNNVTKEVKYLSLNGVKFNIVTQEEIII